MAASDRIATGNRDVLASWTADPQVEDLMLYSAMS